MANQSANVTAHDDDVADPFEQLYVQPAATDRHLSEETSALTGHDLMLVAGLKKDGTVYTNRPLNNVSFRKSKTGTLLVEGHDPETKGMRSYDWNLVAKWQVVS